MNQNESIALIAAVALVGYWYGVKRTKAAASTAAAASSNGLDWLGSWANA
jgi:hypothetical protein